MANSLPKLDLAFNVVPDEAILTNPSTTPRTHHQLTSIRTSNLDTMFLQRTAVAAARRAAVTPRVARTFSTSFVRRT